MGGSSNMSHSFGAAIAGAVRDPRRSLSRCLERFYGMAALLDRMGFGEAKVVEVTAAVVMLLMTEFASTPSLGSVPTPSKVDAYLALKTAGRNRRAAAGIAGEIAGAAIGSTCMLGLPHFQKMLNGYSGYTPASDYQMRELMSGFPDDRSIAFLRRRRVDYVH